MTFILPLNEQPAKAHLLLDKVNEQPAKVTVQGSRLLESNDHFIHN